MGAIAKTLQRSRTQRIEKATLTPTPALGEHLQNRQLEKVGLLDRPRTASVSLASAPPDYPGDELRDPP